MDLKSFFLYKEPKKSYDFDVLNEEPQEVKNDVDPVLHKVEKSLDKNLKYVKQKFTIPKNADIAIREFDITIAGKSIKAFFVICDGLIDGESINECVLKPFMYLKHLPMKPGENVLSFIERQLLPQNQITLTDDIEDLVNKVNFGFCSLFIDGEEKGILIDVKNWEHRGVENPQNEAVVLGPHEGFNEMLRTNTGLVRKIINSPNLIVENVTIGKTSKTPSSIVYLKDVANPKLVDEVRYRLQNIDAQYILTSNDLQQYIEERPFLPMPQATFTERPDRASRALISGKVILMVSGSPQAMILPANFFDMFHSPEDLYMRYPVVLFLRVLRFIALLLAIFSSALFIAITNYHQELILTDILFSLETARQFVPFPAIVEILIMEFAFELIKEAGVRVPEPIGQTLGIVGALILGQAAVAANVVSPILIIVVAVSGLSSFAVPNYSLTSSIRIVKFAYIIGASIAGFLGIITILFVHLTLIFSTKSFGVPVFAPLAPNMGGLTRDLLNVPLWKMEKRHGITNPQKPYEQPKVSRKWRFNKK